jgi:protein SCO1/2
LTAPPPRADLGHWSLVDQTGAPVGDAELRGKVWIAGFFFTRCPTVCPGLMQKLAAVVKSTDDIGDRIHVVAFSVDPEHDTPSVLSDYAQKLQAPADRWTFVTGARAEVEKLLVGKMFVDVGQAKPLPGNADLVDISHSMKFALIDQNGMLRDFWSSDDDSVGQLINAARMLAHEGPGVGALSPAQPRERSAP